jgi:hypothetical protein
MSDVTVDHRATAAQLREKAVRYRMEAALEANGARARGWQALARECEDRADNLDRCVPNGGSEDQPLGLSGLSDQRPD